MEINTRVTEKRNTHMRLLVCFGAIYIIDAINMAGFKTDMKKKSYRLIFRLEPSR